MAKVLKGFEFGSASEGKAKYSWADWSDGQIREFTRGEDFTCKVQTFGMMARKYAKDHELKVRVASKGDTGVVLQFYKPGENGEAVAATASNRRK